MQIRMLQGRLGVQDVEGRDMWPLWQLAYAHLDRDSWTAEALLRSLPQPSRTARLIPVRCCNQHLSLPGSP